MARPKKEMSETSPKTTTTSKKQPTAAERKQFMEKYEQQKKNFAEAKQAFKQIRDVTKTVRQTTISSYNKEDVIRYLQNIDSYESELRGLSRYLFYRSQVYFRLIMYNATMFDLNSRYVVPAYDPTGDNDKESILKDYYETLQVLDRMDLQNSLLPMLINNFIEDVYYGCCWIDETGIFILKIPPEYCRISGKYFTGDFSFSVDMSNYKKFEDILEFLGEPLSSMYKAYGGDSKNKWQPINGTGLFILDASVWTDTTTDYGTTSCAIYVDGACVAANRHRYGEDSINVEFDAGTTFVYWFRYARNKQITLQAGSSKSGTKTLTYTVQGLFGLTVA